MIPKLYVILSGFVVQPGLISNIHLLSTYSILPIMEIIRWEIAELRGKKKMYWNFN